MAGSPWWSQQEPSLGSWYDNGIFLGYGAMLTLNVLHGESWATMFGLTAVATVGTVVVVHNVPTHGDHRTETALSMRPIPPPEPATFPVAGGACLRRRFTASPGAALQVPEQRMRLRRSGIRIREDQGRRNGYQAVQMRLQDLAGRPRRRGSVTSAGLFGGGDPR